MSLIDIAASDLLPHGPEMTLIDSVIESNAERTVAKVRITPASEFVDGHAVPAYVGMEYMAQTIAARVGYECRRLGERPPVGFLLGTRRYVSNVAEFPVGDELLVTVVPLLTDKGFGTFECSIAMGAEIARAVINTYRPSGDMIASLDPRGPES